MIDKRLRIDKSQKGESTIILAMLITMGMGTAVYFAADKLNKDQKQAQLKIQEDKVEQQNLSGLSQVTALMEYVGTNPMSDNPANLPYIYPDPYLFPSGNPSQWTNLVNRIRPKPSKADWSLDRAKLSFTSIANDDLSQDGFDNYLQSGGKVTANNSSSSVVEFVGALRENPNRPYLITGYEVKVASESQEGKQVVNRARVDVPAPLNPTCVLTSQNGQKNFQPNTPMRLVLKVSGIATEAYVPRTTMALISGENSRYYHDVEDISSKANSVRNIGSEVYSWSVTTPRPLQAVDAQSVVTYKAYAYLNGPRQDVASSCSFTFNVTAPASCKLWADKASVRPGECVNLYASMIGPVNSGSFKMTAANAAGSPVSGLVQNGTKGRFCAPRSANQVLSNPVEVSSNDRNRIDGLLAGMIPVQKEAILQATANLVRDLSRKFPDAKSLHSLSINQTNTLLSLSDNQLSELSDLNLSELGPLATLSRRQVRSLREQSPASIRTLPRVELKELEPLQSRKVNEDNLAKLQDEDSRVLASHLQRVLEEQQAPVDYVVYGSVKSLDGASNRCLAHVTAGVNKCPLYGDKFPYYGVPQHLNVNNSWVYKYTFCPSAWPCKEYSSDYPAKTSWEVEGIAHSPTWVESCPAGARCYALQGFEPRTPFVRVDNASQANCRVTTMNRLELGCFTEDTKITMADGSLKKVSLLKEGDFVYNPLLKKAMPIKRITAGGEKHPIKIFRLKGLSIEVTQMHPMLTKHGLRLAKDVQVGDLLPDKEGNWLAVESIEQKKLELGGLVWNFEIDTDSKDPKYHMVVADGVVTGDLFLQETLAFMEKDRSLSRK